MELRHAAPADAEAAARLETACFPAAEAASLASIRARIAAFPDHFWLLFDGGQLVCMVNGMVTDLPDLTDEMYDNAGLHREAGAWQMIFSVATDPAHQKQGLAEQVLRQVIADARAQGRKGLVLTCKDKLVHYYAKFGFVSEGVSGSTHGNVVWYQMRLRF